VVGMPKAVSSLATTVEAAIQSLKPLTVWSVIFQGCRRAAPLVAVLRQARALEQRRRLGGVGL